MSPIPWAKGTRALPSNFLPVTPFPTPRNPANINQFLPTLKEFWSILHLCNKIFSYVLTQGQSLNHDRFEWSVTLTCSNIAKSVCFADCYQSCVPREV